MTRFQMLTAVALFLFTVWVPGVIAAAETIPVVPPEPEQATVRESSESAPEGVASVFTSDDLVSEVLRLRDAIRANYDRIELLRSSDLERADENYRTALASIAPKDMFETEAEHLKRDVQEKSEAALEKAKSESAINQKYDALLKSDVEPLFQRVRTLFSGADVISPDAIAVNLEKYDPEHGVFIGSLVVQSGLLNLEAQLFVPMERDAARTFWKNKDSLIGRMSLAMDVHSLDIEIEEFWLEDPQSARRTEDRITILEAFKDCKVCPEMVVVPAGSFSMGSPSSEKGRDGNEGPRRTVTIPKKFAVGKYEVTIREWYVCVSDGGCSHRPSYQDWGRGERPVINVSWYDAQEYVEWLSRKTGERYRLLSEAEWEYVARAGTTTPFHFGSTISTDQANYNSTYSIYGIGRKDVYRRQTVPVGSFPANKFGLHDVHGNVWEWVEDCWHDSYHGAPSDGSAWISGGNCDSSRRVLRGGSWGDYPGYLRSALRNWIGPGNRNDNNGFRVARTLAP